VEASLSAITITFMGMEGRSRLIISYKNSGNWIIWSEIIIQHAIEKVVLTIVVHTIITPTVTTFLKALWVITLH